jgi:hypothetical protein
MLDHQTHYRSVNKLYYVSELRKYTTEQKKKKLEGMNIIDIAAEDLIQEVAIKISGNQNSHSSDISTVNDSSNDKCRKLV